MAAHELKEALETLKETGVRITPQRHAIWLIQQRTIYIKLWKGNFLT